MIRKKNRDLVGDEECFLRPRRKTIDGAVQIMERELASRWDELSDNDRQGMLHLKNWIEGECQRCDQGYYQCGDDCPWWGAVDEGGLPDEKQR